MRVDWFDVGNLNNLGVDWFDVGGKYFHDLRVLLALINLRSFLLLLVLPPLGRPRVQNSLKAFDHVHEFRRREVGVAVQIRVQAVLQNSKFLRLFVNDVNCFRAEVDEFLSFNFFEISHVIVMI